MSRFVRALLFVLVACWLPATLHCRLEAAGLFDLHASTCDEHPGEHAHAEPSSDDCQDNICPTVESALYKESCAPFALIAPATHDCLQLALAWANLAARDAASPLCPDRFPPPEKLAVTWQFSTRAAPPARAPGLNS